MELTGENEPTRCYLFSNDKPTDFDPILNVRDLNVQSSTEQIMITWKDIKQAQSFILFENDVEIYRGEETRFEKNEFPGKEFCYSVKALGGFGLMGERSDIYCASVATAIPRDIVIDVSKNTLSLNWEPVNGALSYVIYRNDEKIINSDKNQCMYKYIQDNFNLINFNSSTFIGNELNYIKEVMTFCTRSFSEDLRFGVLSLVVPWGRCCTNEERS